MFKAGQTEYGVLNHAKRTLHKASDRANYVRRCWVDADECGIFRLVAKSWRRSAETHKRKIDGSKSSKISNCGSWIGRRGTNQTDHTLITKLQNFFQGELFLSVSVAQEHFDLQTKNEENAKSAHAICIGAILCGTASATHGINKINYDYPTYWQT